jgi:lipopolysaccharide/colanic/teichoic acid biosynthesis glycosyltransferase
VQNTLQPRAGRAATRIAVADRLVDTEFPPAGLTGWRAVTKRLIDVTFGTLGLILLAPLLAVIACLIRLDSPGSAFFRQRRVGRHGRQFMMIKFRTMVDGAEKQRNDLLHLNEADGPVFKIKRDPRVTRVGSWLRKCTLDELPQLVHVVRGEMSLVGPRPLFHEEVDLRDERQRKRLRVKPGITCLWQIERKHHSFDDWMAKDGFYVEHQSLWLDICILARTLAAVLRCVGAS